MMARKERPSKEELERLYWEDGKLPREIGEMYGVSASNVYLWFKKQKINIRSRGERNKLRFTLSEPTKEELEHKYNDLKRSIENISRDYDFSSATLKRIMLEQGIKIRTRKESLSINSRWQTEEEWTQFGLDNKYGEKSCNEIRGSKNPEERSWYNRGKRIKDGNEKSIVRSFPFVRKRIDGEWQTEEEWTQFGLDNGYNRRNPSELENGDNEERSWYVRGMRIKDEDGESVVKSFPFVRKRIENKWETEEEWDEYGIEQGYDERNSTSLSESEDHGERSWLSKGQRERWIKDFEFKRKEKPKGYWKDWNNIERELKQKIEENGGEFPILNGSLATSISRHHNGMNSVKERMGFVEEQEPEHVMLERLLTGYVRGVAA